MCIYTEIQSYRHTHKHSHVNIFVHIHILLSYPRKSQEVAPGLAGSRDESLPVGRLPGDLHPQLGQKW